MRKIIVILVSFSLSVLLLTGCTTMYGRADPETKHALRTFAGGAAGALAAGNVGGAIIGALIVDIYGMTTIKYEDKQLENGKEAAERYKNRRNGDNKKTEEKKEKEKQLGEKKEEEKKVQEKIEKEKKLGEKKEEEKKVEEGKEKDKKIGERKRDEKRVELIIEESLIADQNVRTGSTVEANVQYTLLAPSDIQQIKITETRILSSAEKRMELDKREVIRTQGTYVSKITFTVPDDIPKGYCILFTTISDGKYSKTVKSVFNVI